VERLPRSGQSAARNAAAELAEGELLAFIDDDCVPSPDWLAGLAQAHERAPADALGGRTLNALSDNLYSETTHLLNDVLYDRDDREGWYFAANNLAMPSEGYREVGGFRPEMVHQEDRDLCERWTAHGFGLTRAPEALAYHAHGLTLREFLKQHFTYGQGAHQISEARTQRSGRPPRPEIDLHLEFVRRAWQRESHGALLALLVLVAQAAFFAGYTAKRLLGLPAPWEQAAG
jgi:GT2 family glycosyltransferase